jgi:hypothetical protein
VAIPVFDASCRRFISLVHLVLGTLTHPTYEFLGLADYEALARADPKEGQRVYWNEILARAHMAAATALYRSKQWIDAVDQAASNSNALAFAAALRGLIESAADTTSSLTTVNFKGLPDFGVVIRQRVNELVLKLSTCKNTSKSFLLSPENWTKRRLLRRPMRPEAYACISEHWKKQTSLG